MPPDGTLFGADRVVVYLPVAVQSLADLDGSREQRIRSKIEQFLDSPGGAFEKHPREYVSQVKDRNSKTRAFATWCQNETLGRELSVVHDIYKKSNEGEYWHDIDDLNEDGEEFARMFADLSDKEHEQWMEKISLSSDYMIEE